MLPAELRGILGAVIEAVTGGAAVMIGQPGAGFLVAARRPTGGKKLFHRIRFQRPKLRLVEVP